VLIKTFRINIMPQKSIQSCRASKFLRLPVKIGQQGTPLMNQSSANQLLATAKHHFLAGRIPETESLCHEIISQNPDDPEALHLLGVAAHHMGRQEEARQLINRAIAANPSAANFYNNLGAVLTTSGHIEDAIAAYQKAISLQPTMAEAYNNLGNVLELGGRTDEAIAACRRALELQPEFISAYNNLGKALINNGQADDAVACIRQGLKLAPNDAQLHSNLIAAMQYSPTYLDSTPQEVARWDQIHAKPLRSNIPPHPNDLDPNRPLRIGYVSADFHDNVCALFIWPLLSHHQRRDFEITCYAEVAAPDVFTQNFINASDRWRSTVGATDEQIAAQIRHDQIDILVDLKLHTSENRLLTFARKPAPVQITWLGYPGSSGLATMDYRFTDSYLEPPDQPNQFPDRPHRLPGCFWCYDPLGGGPDVQSAPALRNGYVTFGCLNNIFKFNHTAADLWAGVLRELPDSRMIMLAPAGSARQRALEMFSKRGIQSDRLEFFARQPRQDYLSLYHRIDICLDTVPYNGHTTSQDAMWMGVPVITLTGNHPVSRAGWSELCNLGLKELAASSVPEFTRIATQLARDLPRLSALRSSLRPRMVNSPLMDAKQFALAVEQAYRTLWQEYVRGKQ
jgi:protein O-GlcNAc transferase